MTGFYVTLGIVAVVIVLIVLAMRASKSGGETRERAKWFAFNAKRKAKAEAKLAQPIPDSAADAWHSRVSDDDSS